MTKINNTFIGNAEDLDIVMPMYNLLEYNNNYSMTSGSLWDYYRDKVNDGANEIMMLVSTGSITTKQQQVNILSKRQN